MLKTVFKATGSSLRMVAQCGEVALNVGRMLVKVTRSTADFIDPSLDESNQYNMSNSQIDRQRLFQRFDQIKNEHLTDYVAHYLINLARRADWSIALQDQIYDQYGRHLGIPTIPITQFVQEDQAVDVHPYLLDWLKSQEMEVFPELGLFDNYHTAFKRWGEREAEQLFENWPT